MTVSVTASSNTGTFPGGQFTLGPAIISSAFASLETIALTFGSATYIATTGPAGSYGVLIQAPTGNLVSLTLKGTTGDTGIAFNNMMLYQFFAPASANLVGLTSAAGITGVVTLTFF